MKLKKVLMSILCAFTMANSVLAYAPATKVEAAGTYQGTVSIGTRIQTGIQLEGLERPGNVWTLTVNGSPALCVDHYKTTYEGATYTRSSASNVNPIAIKAYRWYRNGSGNQNSYIIAQVVAWGAIHGVYNDLESEAAKNFLDAAMYDIIGSAAWELLKSLPGVAGDWVNLYLGGINNTSASTSGIYYYDNGYNQPVITDEPGEQLILPDNSVLNSNKSATEIVNISVFKTDSATSQPLQGVQFEVYRDNVKLGTITTDANGNASTVSTQSYTATSANYTYCKNWNKLSAEQQAALRAQGVYSSQTAAQVAADADAQAKANALASQNHTYRVVEVGTRNNYYLNPSTTTQSTVVQGSGNANFTFSNERQTGSITITKRDAETNVALSGVVYELYAKNNIVHPDGKTGVVYTAGQYITTFLATNAQGTTTLSDLYLGDYEIVEIQTKNGYVLNTSRQTVSITSTTPNQKVFSTSLTITNEPQTGSIVVSKTDAETDNALDGAVFELYAKNDIMKPDGTGVKYSAGSLVATFPKTGEDGKARLDGLYLGDYRVVEKTAPDKYTINTKTYDVSLTYKGQEYEVTDTQTVNHSNTAVRGEVTLQKTDAEIENGTVDDPQDHDSQNEATLEGAVYGLYAKNDIVHPDGATGVVRYDSTSGSINEITLLKGNNLNVINTSATAGTLIATAETDENGEISFGHLYLGDYYIKEITPSEGYLVDSVAHDFTLSYEGQNVSVVDAGTLISKEQVKKQAAQIVKINASDDDDAVALPEVEFTFIANKYIEEYGTFEAALEVAKANDGRILASEWDVITTDVNGYAITKELPYGKYYVRETVVPDEKYAVEDFYVTVEEDSRTPQNWIFKNDVDYTQRLALVKMDAETGKVVKLAGATFKIKNLDTGEYLGRWEWSPLPVYKEQWTTTEEGAVFLADPLPVGNYQVEEIYSPEGYLLNTEPLKFEVSKKLIGEMVDSNGNPVQTGPDGSSVVLTAIIRDISVKGTITVSKSGEVLTGAHTDNNGNIVFEYEERPLEGAVYDIYAREDIMDPSNDGTVLYEKDELVTQITTGEDGTATTDPLPLGSYYVKENTAPDGMVASDAVEYADLVYENQNVAIVTDSVSFSNERQKVEINAQKKNSLTNELVAGAEFTLYAKTDIVDADGNVVVNADEKIETGTTDHTGKLTFSADLPLGTYYVKETKAPVGYNSTEKVIDIDATYQGQDVETIVYETADVEFVNHPTRVEIAKQDKETGVLTAGNTLQLFDSEGNLIEEWVTELNKTKVFTYLKVGEEYRIVEKQAADGYLKADDITFVVEDMKDAGTIQVITPMKDDKVKGSITVSKQGEVLVGVHKDANGTTQFDYEVQYVPNAVFEVYAAADIKHPDGVTDDYYKAGDLVATLTTGSNGTATLDNLPLGNYRIIEKTAPNGFVNNPVEKYIELTYKDQYTEVVFGSTSFTNIRQKVEIDASKHDSETATPLAGAEFTIYAKENIYDVNGRVVVNADEAIETITTGTDGKASFTVDFPLGKYYVKETKAPIGYANNDVVIEVDASYQGQEVTLISTETGFTNDITKVEISKKDITTGEELPGATLAVYPADENGEPILGEAFDTWVSGKTPHMIVGLEINKYYVLREMVAPFDNGFVTSEDVLFYVEDTGEVQPVEMVDDITKVEFSKTDLATGELIGGATLAVYPVDEDGNILKGECFETWLSVAGETHTIYQIPVGNYVLVEEVAPFDNGYVTAEPVYFEVKDTPDVQTVLMEDDHTKVDFSKTDITTGEPVIGAQLAVIPLDENGEPKLGETFETWITDGTEHRIEYLPIGDYILRETVAPFDNGYVTAEDVKFTVDNTGVVQKVEMKDDYTKVEISKLDPDGNFVEGTVLQVIPVLDDGTLDDGASFETFITGDSSHLIERIPVGTYVLRELTAPDGYVKASDIMFEVKDTPEVQEVEMINKQVIMSKVDVAGEEVEGASMKVLDEEGNVVDEWTSGKEPHAISGLVVGETYTLVEDLAPVGYVLANSIQFTVADDGQNQPIEMVDKQVLVSKVDIAGEEIEGASMKVFDEDGNVVDEWISGKEPHAISNLEIGKTYTLVEDLAPVGYAIASSIEFTVSEEREDQYIEMVDKIVSVNKVDADGNPVVGATLQVVSTKTKNIVDQWTTDGEPHNIEGLVVGGEYILREIETPEGYVKASDITFEVSEENVNQEITMTDKQVIIHKKDDHGNYVVGAKLAVVDMDGNIVDEWTTGKEGHAVSGLEVGKEYILRELEVPSGYEKAEDMRFTVSDDLENQEFVMTDKLVPVDTAVDNSTMVFSCVGLGSLLILMALWLLKRTRKA